MFVDQETGLPIAKADYATGGHWMVACPNCHRRHHHTYDANEPDDRIIRRSHCADGMSTIDYLVRPAWR